MSVLTLIYPATQSKKNVSAFTTHWPPDNKGLTLLRAPVFNVSMVKSSAQATPSKNVTFFLILTTFLWGGSFVFNKIGFRDIPPVTFMVLRFTLATLIMAAVSFRRLPRLTSSICCKGVAVGLALAA